MQDVFAQLWRHAGEYASARERPHWLYAIARNRIVDAHRAPPLGQAADNEDSLSAAEIDAALDQAVCAGRSRRLWRGCRQPTAR